MGMYAYMQTNQIFYSLLSFFSNNNIKSLNDFLLNYYELYKIYLPG